MSSGVIARNGLLGLSIVAHHIDRNLCTAVIAVNVGLPLPIDSYRGHRDLRAFVVSSHVHLGLFVHTGHSNSHLTTLIMTVNILAELVVLTHTKHRDLRTLSRFIVVMLVLSVIERQQAHLRQIVVGYRRLTVGEHGRAAPEVGVGEILRQIRHIDGISVVEAHIGVMRSVVLLHVVAATRAASREQIVQHPTKDGTDHAAQHSAYEGDGAQHLSHDGSYQPPDHPAHAGTGTAQG